MKPDREGIWEWFEEDGTKRLVAVHDVGCCGESWLRVYWWGGYYNVNPEIDPRFPDHKDDSWPDRWGKFVGYHGDIPEKRLYLEPTAKEREEIYIRANYEKPRS